MSSERAEEVIELFIQRLEKIQLFQFDVRREGRRTVIQARGSKFKGRVEVSEKEFTIEESSDAFQKEMIV